MSAGSEHLIVGRLGAAHGVRGELRVHSFTDPPENLLAHEQLWLRPAGRSGSWRPVRILAARQQGQVLLSRLEGVTDREQARALTGSELAVEAAALPQLEPGEYYWHQLLGLAVTAVAGQRLGRVDYLIETEIGRASCSGTARASGCERALR